MEYKTLLNTCMRHEEGTLDTQWLRSFDKLQMEAYG